MLYNQYAYIIHLNYICTDPFMKGDIYIEKTYTEYTNNILCMLTKHLLDVEIYTKQICYISFSLLSS